VRTTGGDDYTDWRMPMQNELVRLYDAGKTYQSECILGFGITKDIHLTKLFRLSCTIVWASEINGDHMGGYCDFWNGVRSALNKSHNDGQRALPVRSAK
jgi:hypothetical protein